MTIKNKILKMGLWVEKFSSMIFGLISINAKFIYKGFQKILLKEEELLGFVLINAGFSLLIVRFKLHFIFLKWFSPAIFKWPLLFDLYSSGIFMNFLVVFTILSLIITWVLGIIPHGKYRAYQNALDDVSLKNAKDFKPKVVGIKQSDPYRTKIKVMAPGVGAVGLRKTKEKLESSFESNIEEIKSMDNPKFVEVTLTTKKLPKLVKFSDLQRERSRPYSFIVGESKKGVINQSIVDLPHLMIAGTTGGGKSQFFKQMLLGLLENSDHLQMYLIDLKGGLEFRPFSSLPNVKTVKTPEEAVALLEGVKNEMEKRFKYLDHSGEEIIEPCRDKKDRIIVGIDEASVLFANAKRGSEDYELIIKARNLTEYIAKLSRCASINLILATQKVTKDTIDTRIQENISGRVCFKLNTIEGSIRVLGNGRANDLPAIAGRGIWQFGCEQIEIQAPFIESTELRQRLKFISTHYQDGKKKLFQKMLPIGNLSVSLPKPEDFSDV